MIIILCRDDLGFLPTVTRFHGRLLISSQPLQEVISMIKKFIISGVVALATIATTGTTMAYAVTPCPNKIVTINGHTYILHGTRFLGRCYYPEIGSIRHL